MAAYYNEIDSFAAQWLRNLIRAGLICPGDVDERDIRDVRPNDLRGYVQCHFFAGVGVWSHALRTAGWGDDRAVWTGSCPCQPFSAAGQGAGFADERHLWPAFFHLIQERRPSVVFGEQVASKDAEPWLDLVQDDLEAVDYALGAVPFPAAGVGAPNIRDRLYWVANTAGARLEGRQPAGERSDPQCQATERDGAHGGLGDSRPAGPVNGHWRDADWLRCRDAVWRPVEPGSFPLAHGVTNRVGRLRAYGNAIAAPAARAFVEAYLETP